LDSLQLKKDKQNFPLRFAVQDIYNFSKRIIAGKVVSGVLRQHEMVTILPTGETTRIQSVEEYGKIPTNAETGKCIGITTTDKVFCDRGYIFSNPDDIPVVTHTFHANIFWMDKVPCKKGQTIIFRCSTQESLCTITAFHTIFDSSSLEQIGSHTDEIKNREVAQVTIHTDNPVILEEFYKTAELGRFVLVTNDICAGGIITEVLP
jgi:sulfate adenylyltransferase subunit 1 (EFTu-like GTPase family)